MLKWQSMAYYSWWIQAKNKTRIFISSQLGNMEYGKDLIVVAQCNAAYLNAL